MRISDCSSDVCSSDLGSAVAEQAGAFIDRLARVPERLWDRGAGLDALLEGAREPFVLRGLVADWPLVEAGKRSARDARAYLLDHARDRPFKVSIGAPGHDGRLFYDAEMEMNFRSEEHTSELQSLMRISYAVFCLNTKKSQKRHDK